MPGKLGRNLDPRWPPSRDKDQIFAFRAQTEGARLPASGSFVAAVPSLPPIPALVLRVSRAAALARKERALGVLPAGWSLKYATAVHVMRRILLDASLAEPAAGRALLDHLAVPARVVPGVRVRAAKVDGLSGAWFTPAGDDFRSGKCVLFLHGGGYHIGSVRSYAQLIASLCRRADMPVLAIDYRLCPEHPYPAALHDALIALRFLRRLGFTGVGLCGDSAGGHLALSATLALREANEPAPSALALICPWLDMALERPSRTSNLAFDVLPEGVGTVWGRQFYGRHDPGSKEISPINGDLAGLPPCLVQVGDRETLRDEIVEFAWRAQAAGSNVTLSRYAEMVHDFHFFEPLQIPEARQAMRELGDFLRGTLE